MTGGAVRIGGHDVRDVTMDSLRASIGLVMEDSFLFSDTVRANISYGRPDATAEQIVAAARAAEADGFIGALPDGYDTVVGEQGLTLSGGQRQRVALARALITDPAILVLDDATSAIDARVEAQIHETLRRVMAGRTTLLIAHRRSTLQLADKIAVLDAGRLVDLGTHEELAERCPLYRLLLSGPGEDAEGVDAGELAYYENGDDRVAGREQDRLPTASRRACGQRTWHRTRPIRRRPRRPAELVTRPPAIGRPAAWASAAGAGRPRRPGPTWPSGGMLAGLPPTPELLAKVAALPPANDQPEVDRGLQPGARSEVQPAPAAEAVHDRADRRADPGRPRRDRRGRAAVADARRHRPRHRGQGLPRDHPGVGRPRWRSCWPTGSSTRCRPWSSAATANGCSTRCGSRSSLSCSGSGSTSTSAR